MLTLNNKFKEKLLKITELSKKANKNNSKEKIFKMIKQHITEIEDLYHKKDDHWMIETADLIILCYEFLIMHNVDIDFTFTKALPRFDKKLTKIIGENNS